MPVIIQIGSIGDGWAGLKGMGEARAGRKPKAGYSTHLYTS